jgi:alkylation response protein AidB-like acyl-CoA dehydrogenase
MIFRLSEEQKMLQSTIRKICEKDFAPRAAEIDELEKFPWENKRILEEKGIFAINCPEEYGGAGPGMVSLAMVIEEVARVCASTSHMISTQALVTDALIHGGNHEQKLKWLKPMAEGSVIGALAITEADAGSDVTGIRTTAVPKNGGYVINGYKRFITHGGVAGITVVVAYTDKAKAHKGISLFVVTKETPGFTSGKKEKKLGMRASDTTDVILEDCFVPEENRIGLPGEGFLILMKILNYSRPAVAAEAVGISQAALDAVINYSKTRTQFGKTLAEFQGLQWRMAEMALKVELAKTMLYRTCFTIDNEPNSPEIPRLSAMAKWFASDTAMQVTTDAVQIFGGYGCSKEYPVERWMRDAKITQVYEGTNEICRIVITKQIFK